MLMRPTRRQVWQAAVPVLCAGLLPALPRAAQASGGGGVVRAIDAHARPLRSTEPSGDLGDLRAFGQMVDGASVVGLGEATHNSHEFFTMKHRVFQYLVRAKGFRAFAQEVHVGAALRIDDYVVSGQGDIRQIMDEEFQSATRLWNTREYLGLFQWMRAYNARHRQKLRYVGNDVDYPGEELFVRVDGYLRGHYPELVPVVGGLYTGLRPTAGMDVWTTHYPRKPLAERQTLASRAREVVALLRRHGAEDMVVQYAEFISQVATLYSYDLDDRAELLKALQHREQAMADNTVWWNRRTGGRTLLSAHNGHVTYFNSRPDYPYRIQGDLLREQLGRGYVSVGFTFHHGSFNAAPPGGDDLLPVTVGAPERGSNEFTLDQSRYRDYVLDMRTAPALLRDWLSRVRPTRDIGTDYPDEPRPIVLGASHDVLIHLHRIRAATLL
ncbi:erythromycin esterase family protein [Actinomadura roseirufa]|uniref:erythromycin esterase family protein n=1 Tax=Actinomadura roseirufa TaxID=2094049 RepID=UPI001040E6B4|nr:erythromycin esterase family protein [Actinomadura roseirufa]